MYTNMTKYPLRTFNLCANLFNEEGNDCTSKRIEHRKMIFFLL